MDLGSERQGSVGFGITHEVRILTLPLISLMTLTS